MSCQDLTPDRAPTLHLSALLLTQAASANCEEQVSGVLGEPVSTVSSLAFVVAAVAVAAGRRGPRPVRSWFVMLLAATGLGSVIQHGWDVPGADLVHDLPMAALIVLVAVDAARDLLDRRVSDAWWLVPTIGLVPVIVAAPRAGDALQFLMAVVAVALAARRIRRRPALRGTILGALALLAVGGLIGTLARQGWPLCESGLLPQGHAVWHVLAATGLWLYARALTPRRPAGAARAPDGGVR